MLVARGYADFAFQPNDAEASVLRSQFVTLAS
jgi:hypothetical protein